MSLPTSSPSAVRNDGQVLPTGAEPANLGDILERVLDRGIVIAGDVRVNLLDIELLTLKLRLVIASVDTARQLGIDWWAHDPFLSSRARQPVGPEPVGPEPVGSEPAESELIGAEPIVDEVRDKQLDEELAEFVQPARPPVRRRRTGRGS